MSQKMTSSLAAKLASKFPQIADLGWEEHSLSRPVTIEIERIETPPREVSIEAGRYNNRPDFDYHHGIRCVTIATKTGWRTITCEEGETDLASLIREGDVLLILKHSSRNRLLRGGDDGSCHYTVYTDPKAIQALRLRLEKEENEFLND